MIILGINYFFHDSTACLLVDGKLVTAIEEERLTRQKHTSAFPERAIERCLAEAGVTAREVDHIALSIKPGHDWAKKAAYLASHPTNAGTFLKHELGNTYYKQRGLMSWYARTYGPNGARPPLHFIPHHLAHAVGSFYLSPYDEAALLSLDGSGEWATSFAGVGEGSTYREFRRDYFPMSLGAVYEAATEFCGFKPNYDEGKTMGLSAYGDPEVFYPAAAQIVGTNGDQSPQIDLSYFGYQFWGQRRCSDKFHRTFGSPRSGTKAPFERHHYDVAAAFQRVLEERVLPMARNLKKTTGKRHLVISGGVALNSVMNGRILREAGFDDIYVMPAAGDNGTALGAASYVYHHLLGRPRSHSHEDPYLGPEYSEAAMEAVLKECKLPYRKIDDIGKEVARHLEKGKIVGWYQGRMEIGPRALGNRTILANPTLPDMKDKLNAEVKHRESFRPFAPSVAAEHRSEYFDISQEAPFMLKVCDVRSDLRESLPAITHADGTARLQTVREESNPRYHHMISEVGKLTGIPCVLNTSFNIMGEPIIESPIQAVRCYASTGIDALAVGDFFLEK